MPVTNASEGFSGLRQWSGPIVYDRLSAAYCRIQSDDALAHRLARLHAGAFRALIDGDMRGFEALRAGLVAALGDAALSRRHLALVDAEIMAELLEVVDSRYSRSLRTAAAYRLALAELSRKLRPEIRAAA